ncbi:hypothetical protein [uncultured Draconibacterium sp.]|uniref:hypothetical protein n=1 Tax=uncultured Draconibacterium sp. TaxID=1573823 RepID=UPI002AA7F290|nr:hypothetical protein [uncultured Draconibacterium sp.]
MKWIFYIVCFLLLGINSANETSVSSQLNNQSATFAATIQNSYVITPTVFVSEDLDSEGFSLGSALLSSNNSTTYFSEIQTGIVQYTPETYSYLLSAWLIDLPPPSLV